MHAQLALYNAKIYTFDPQHPLAEAIAFAGEQILALGNRDEILDLLAPDGEAVDLRGATLLPGLVDGHFHLAHYSLGLQEVNLHGTTSLDEALQRVAERANQTPPGTWIRGSGWDRNIWPTPAFPTRYDLDRITPHHPVALHSKDLHSLWVNSLALQQTGITPATPDPPGGQILRDPATGEPTGILQEAAVELVTAKIPAPTLDELVLALRQGIDNLTRIGLTGIHNCEGPLTLAALQELRRRGDLPIRILSHIPLSNLPHALGLGLRDGFGDPWLRIVGVKCFIDGALGSRSAWMIDPYEDEPENRGIPTLSPEAFREAVLSASHGGLSIAVHAIGDAANRMVLDTFEQLRPQLPAHLRHRIEHVQLLHPDDLPRLAQLGLIASMQPIHATSDIEIAERHWGKRARWSYAWRSLLDAGTTLAFGSDCPVEDPSPLKGLYAAITRRRPDGTPPGGWYPQERLTVEQAIRAYTYGNAYAASMEHLLGSLTPGKLADCTALSCDPFNTPPEALLEAQVIATVVGGKFAYRDPSLG